MFIFKVNSIKSFERVVQKLGILRTLFVFNWKNELNIILQFT